MYNRIPGAPNVPLTNAVQIRKPILEENIDRGQQNFHHATLVSVDSEWSAICKITEIMPYIYIGGYQNAIDTKQLLDKNIKLVVSLLKDSRKPEEVLAMYNRNAIHHVHYDVDNLVDEPLCDVFQKTFELICKFVVAKRSVLIHCAQGVSTAPAVVAYYTLKMYYSNQKSQINKLPAVIERIRKNRACVDINIGFIEQLEDAEAELSGRPVQHSESLSTRRNVTLRKRMNDAMLNTVLQERK